ncbi:olfactory receptor 12D3-like [Protobothrops mucrosquamatus]|uniref:olfactory receptor 12D3-like n=1 Tax=Protobothrops mucrosquamatus TaxID=103944 RepID=UPI00077570EF|nr:olfactory receptor 12D3-like [Protobothrops mucrosquamatus]
MENQTKVEQFILLGLKNDLQFQYITFGIFLLLYLATLMGNGAIVMVVLAELHLHKPMYFFLGNLSCLDIIHSTVTIPKMLQGFLVELQTISFNGCMVQLFFFYFMGGTEGILLGIMAYDRYVAICNPLRYTLIMRKDVCILMVIAAWSMAFFHALMHAIMTARLPFCGPNIIEHFICDIKPLLKLACGSIHLNLMLLSIVTSCVVMSPFIFILFSYFYIITYLLFKVQSKSGWQKAFSTCGSHLTVVALVYIPVLFNYMLPSVGTSSQQDMAITLIYSAVTPVLNPFIYTLRNKEVKMTLKVIFGRKIFTFW